MLTVSNNLLALNSANQLKTNVNTKVKSMEKLSTGYRINKAADPSGYFPRIDSKGCHALQRWAWC